MKVISSHSGTVALAVSADDVTPHAGVMSRDLISFISSTYNFAVTPMIPEGVPPFAIQTFTFQSGALSDGNNQIPIFQLNIVPNGDIIFARDTDAADKVMNDFTARLVSTFGYRFEGAQARRIYQSALVVEFEDGIESFIEALAKIEGILNSKMSRADAPFKIKKLGFGYGDPTATIVPTVEGIENSDFLLERRANEPYSKNRYFCTAPTRTEEFIKILETIEASFRE